MQKLEDDIAALAGRFANELLALLRRAPLDQLAPMLRARRAKTPRGSVDAWAMRYKLTHAETAILRAMVAGKVRREIATIRGTSTVTIKKQIHDLLRKTGDRSTLAATNRLLREQHATRS